MLTRLKIDGFKTLLDESDEIAPAAPTGLASH